MMRSIEVTGKTHSVKSWPTEFEAVADGIKTFEVRRNDRDYQPGDVLVLREYVPTPDACGVSEDYRPGRSQYGPCNLKAGHIGLHEQEYGYTGREERAIITYVYRSEAPGAPIVLYGAVPGKGPIDGSAFPVVVLALASNIDIGQ